MSDVKYRKVGEIKENHQGSLMKIIEYRNANDIDIEFLDDFHYKIYGVRYRTFNSGNIRNPYHPSVFNVGITGIKYPISINRKHTKEYTTWKSILKRCFSESFKKNNPTYRNVTCCKEWLNYENFYEWLHNQDNFDRWYNGERWAVDKDILIKGNKTYSPETCCLVPQNVNALFTKRNNDKNELPTGVCKDMKSNKYISCCRNPITKKSEWLGKYNTLLESFNVYRIRKKYIIKQIAEIEYKNNNITKECYTAMINYEIEIDD